MLYIPELKIVENCLDDALKEGNFVNADKYFKEIEKIKENYFTTPLKEMGKRECFNKNIFTKVKENVANLYK